MDQGSHSELMRKEGVYSKFVKMQVAASQEVFLLFAPQYSVLYFVTISHS